VTVRATSLLACAALALACSSSGAHGRDVAAEADAGGAADTAAAALAPDSPAAPDARAVAPDARAVAPDVGAVTPDVGALAPDVRGAAPDVGAAACRGTILQDGFEGADDRGWTHAALEAKLGDPWLRGAARNPACHGGTACWASGLDGTYPNCQEAALVSPVVDLSACDAAATVRVSWWQWMSFEPFAEGTYFDSGLVQISRDGGATWSYLPAPGPEPPYVGTCGTHDDGCGSPLPFVRGQRVWSDQKLASWREAHVDVPAAYRTKQFRVRFVFASDFKMASRGWLIDDLAIAAP
jgi:hypothetical protein